MVVEGVWLVLIWLLIIGGIIALFLAFICLFNQSLLEKIGSLGQQIIIDISKNMLQRRKLWGIIYLVVGIILVYCGYLTLTLL